MKKYVREREQNKNSINENLKENIKNNKKAINSVYKILDIANPLLLSINIISYHSFNIITFFKRKNHIFYKYGFTLDIYPYNITKVIICVLIIRFLKGFLGR